MWTCVLPDDLKSLFVHMLFNCLRSPPYLPFLDSSCGLHEIWLKLDTADSNLKTCLVTMCGIDWMLSTNPLGSHWNPCTSPYLGDNEVFVAWILRELTTAPDDIKHINRWEHLSSGQTVLSVSLLVIFFHLVITFSWLVSHVPISRCYFHIVHVMFWAVSLVKSKWDSISSFISLCVI